jgi:PKD domain-containing protein
MSPRLLVAVAATVALVPLAAPSSAAPEDEPGTPVVVAASAEPPQVSGLLRAPDGTEYAGLATVSGGKGTARVARRLPGSDWEEAVALSRPSPAATAPRIALLPDGGVAAVWTEFSGQIGSVWYAESSLDGRWSDPVMLTADGREPALAVGTDGDSVAVWRTSTLAIAAVERAAGFGWTAPAVISEPGNAGQTPDVAIDAAGDTVVVYEQVGPSRVRSIRKPAGGAWSQPADVSSIVPLGNVDDVQVLVDGDGIMTAVWVQRVPADASTSVGRVDTARLTPDATVWGPTVAISEASADLRWVAADLDAGGTITAAWTEGSDAGHRLSIARGAGGQWTEPEPTGAGALAGPASLEVLPDGRAVAGWLAEGPDGARALEVATASAAGTWSDARPVVTDAFVAWPHVALTDEGDVSAVYAQYAEGVGVRAVFADRSAPAIGSLLVPANATAGTPVELALAATDRRSAVDAVAWDLGDGSTGTGTTTRHTYASAGEYRVTARVFDAAGNVATAAATITVAVPPPAPAPVPGPTPRAAAQVRSLHLGSARIRAVGARAKAPRATRLDVRLSDASSATVVIAGRRRGLPTVTLTRPVTADRATLTLRAKVGGRALPPGRYVIAVTADGPGGQSRPARVTLRVVGTT